MVVIKMRRGRGFGRCSGQVFEATSGHRCSDLGQAEAASSESPLEWDAGERIFHFKFIKVKD